MEPLLPFIRIGSVAPSGDSPHLSVGGECNAEQFTTLREMAALINSSLDPATIRQTAIEVAKNVLRAEGASLLLLDEATGELYFDSAVGDKAEGLKRIRLQPGTGIAGWVAERGESVIVNDAAHDSRFYRGADRATSFQTRNIICSPVTSRGRLIGVLEGVNKLKGGFDDVDLQVIEAMGHNVGVAIENGRLYEQLKETFYRTAQVLAEAIELRDPYTGGHTQRVHDYSLIIARRLEMDREELERLRLAALLHDIGKIGVKDSVLLKTGPLTADEFEEIKKHPIHGAELLKTVTLLSEVTPGIRSHHERFDGRGYPDGLGGEEIPLHARIIAVADAFDAMTSNRSYKKPRTGAQGLRELQRCSGTQFDPQMVSKFLEVMLEGQSPEGQDSLSLSALG